MSVELFEDFLLKVRVTFWSIFWKLVLLPRTKMIGTFEVLFRAGKSSLHNEIANSFLVLS
jgi:hypothetical protein